MAMLASERIDWRSPARRPGIVRALAEYPHVPGLALWRAIELEVWDAIWAKIQPQIPAGPYLDLACGAGNFTRQLGLPQQPIGLDIDEDLVQLASASGYEQVIAGSACAMPFPDDCFAYVFSNSSLEHVRGVDAAFAEVRRVLKPGGLFAFIVPTTDFGKELFRPWLLRALGLTTWAETIRERVLRDTDTFNRCSAKEWAEKVTTAGLTILQSNRFMTPGILALWELLHYGYTKPLLGKCRIADVMRRYSGLHQRLAGRLLAGAVRRGKEPTTGVQMVLVAQKCA